MVGLLEGAVILFALFALSRAVLRWREGQVTWREALFWGVLWAGVILLVLIQEKLGLFGKYIESRRPVDVLIYISILLLFYLIFRLYVKMDNLSSDLTLLVRQQALGGKRKR